MLSYTDEFIREILITSRVIAMIGASPRADRPSHGVMRYLLGKGHRVYPINPTCVGEEIHGQSVLNNVDDVPEPIDMVDIFRRSALAGDAVDDAIRVGAKTVWMQLDVIDPLAAERAETAGIAVVMDRCPVIEYRRLGLDQGDRKT